ncbi:unnamed protein product [Chrysoparadoxa australica]
MALLPALVTPQDPSPSHSLPLQAGIRNSQLKMSFRSVMKDGEWQRPLTAVLYHDKVDLQFWVTLFFLYTVASQLERRLFSKKPAAFLTQLVFGLAFITLPGYWIRDLRLPLANEVFGMFLLTWYGIECGTDSVLLGPLPIPAFLVPMAYLGSRYYRSARSLLLLKKLLLGVGAGLLISLMNPNEEKARRLKRERYPS